MCRELSKGKAIDKVGMVVEVTVVPHHRQGDMTPTIQKWRGGWRWNDIIATAAVVR